MSVTVVWRFGPRLNGDAALLDRGNHPFVRGPEVGRISGVVIRAMMPNAARVECLLGECRVEQLDCEVAGELVNLFAVFLPGVSLPLGSAIVLAPVTFRP